MLWIQFNYLAALATRNEVSQINFFAFAMAKIIGY